MRPTSTDEAHQQRLYLEQRGTGQHGPEVIAQVTYHEPGDKDFREKLDKREYANSNND